MSAGAKLVQGSLFGAAHREDFPANVVDVHQPRDEHGVYLDYFVITLFSGTKVRVTVSDEE